MTLINPGYVKAEDFEVETINRGTICYREYPNEVSLEREAGYDPEHYTAIYLTNVREWDTPKGEAINKVSKVKIASNLEKAFELMNGRLKIE